MKKRDKKQPAELPNPVVKPISPIYETPPKYRQRWVVLMLIICGYWLLFYGAQPARSAYWQLLMLPDVIFKHWTNDSGTISLLDRVPIWLVSFWWLATAYAAGSLLLRTMKVTALSNMEWFVFATSLGLGALSLFTMLVGLCGGLQVKTIFLLLAVGLPLLELRRFSVGQAPACRNVLEEAGRSLPYGYGDIIESTVTPSRWFWLCILPLTLLYLLAGAMPPVEFDVREYHLQVPKEWYQTGRITFMPHNVYGNMPLGAEMHALGCMELWLGNDAWWYGALAGKQVIALFAPLTALALWCAGQRFYSAGCGTLAAVVYLSFPWIAHVSFHGLIDGVVAHYAFVALYVALIAGTDRCWQLLAGLLAGSAAACKYPAVLFVVLPVLIIITWRTYQQSDPDQRNRNVCITFAMFIIACALTGGAWYAKNAFFTGNPVYPLAGKLFGGEMRTPEQIEQWEKAHAVPKDSNGNRYSARQAFDSARHLFLQSQWLSPILWPLALLGVVGIWQTTSNPTSASISRWMLLYILSLFMLWWLLTHRLDRFWLPAVPMLALLAGSSWQWANDRRTRGYLLGSVAISTLFCMLMMISPVKAQDGSLWFLGEWRWLTPLQTLRTELSPSHAQLNSVVLADEAVLLVGDAVPFDLNMPVYYNTCFDSDTLESLTRYRTADEIRQAFHERHIAYVLVDWKELRRYRSPKNYGYSDYPQPSVFHKLVKANVLSLRWQDNETKHPAWQIYEVK